MWSKVKSLIENAGIFWEAGQAQGRDIQDGADTIRSESMLVHLSQALCPYSVNPSQR